METRRNFLKTVGLGVAAMAVQGCAWGQTAPAGRPNIVLIMADDMGFSDVGCYGGEIETPNIDALAQNGVRFTHIYNNAKCGPTRASLLTGLYEQQVGDRRMKNAVTIAEVLKGAGYRTLMTGKWHLARLPVQRGFDRHFGLLSGASNHFNPGVKRPGEKAPGIKMDDLKRRWAVEDKIHWPYTPEDKDFYTTDAFTDYALDYLDEYGAENNPFFLYVAYTAPHYPIQARPADIAKYRGKYRIGWDVIRERRYKRLVEMGLIDKRWKMPPRDKDVPSWDSIKSEVERDEWDLKMSVYSAMIDRVDQNVGRIVDKLHQLGKFDNTLIIFLSDNGGTAEVIHRTPDIPPGPMESYRTVDLNWANASNTPFRRYKAWDHEGGITTPLIAHWPGEIKNRGEITHGVGHVIDIMATCVDVSGAKYPETYDGFDVLPLKGKSLLPLMKGCTRKGHEAIFWAFGKSKAVRKGKWKLVKNGESPWELYDMESDRTELNELSDKYPARVKEMAALHADWVKKCEEDSAKEWGRFK
ncbi:sulfatase-like hydrolase/transferase [Candidatus Hydrogenedentota bacterium]